MSKGPGPFFTLCGAWLLLLIGASVVLAGIVDLTVGTQLAQFKPGVAAAEAGARWPSFVLLLVGIAIVALGVALGNRGRSAGSDPDRGDDAR